VVGGVYNLLRSLPFLVWLAGGIGGVFPDLDHIPALLGYRYTIPVLKELNDLFGITIPNEPFGRPLHGLLLVVALVLSWYSITRLRRYNKVGFLR